ncbi:MAG TPA: nucleotidyltransferase domain-containing protein [Acidimicrobiales bacterium]|nr:nucleotidyltransferase domain-containing protein [Acidimicrobiales bacterium]
MRIREGLEVDDEQLAKLCTRHSVIELAVFGSVLRDDFAADSDVDVLVTFAPGTTPPWGGARFALELEELIGRRVDIGERDAIHWVIRPHVLTEARVLYAVA